VRGRARDESDVKRIVTLMNNQNLADARVLVRNAPANRKCRPKLQAAANNGLLINALKTACGVFVSPSRSDSREKERKRGKKKLTLSPSFSHIGHFFPSFSRSTRSCFCIASATYPGYARANVSVLPDLFHPGGRGEEG